jgi:IclR family KDG regulon transcriptional repressor
MWKDVQVVGRAVRILELLGENGHITLTSLSTKAELPVSTVSRILHSLTLHGFAEMDSFTRSYRLGPRLLFLSARANPRRELIDLARPVLKRLAGESHEDVGLSVLQGTHAVIIDRVEGPEPLKIMEPLGQPVPLYCGAFSKILLAFQDLDFIEQYVASTRLVRFTPSTTMSKKVLREELRRIRKLGQAVSFGEYFPDGAGAAAAVFGFRDEIIAAVFLSGPRSRITRDRAPGLVKLVTGAAQDLTRRLRGERSPIDRAHGEPVGARSGPSRIAGGQPPAGRQAPR